MYLMFNFNFSFILISMAGFASQALLRSKYEDLIDESEQDVSEKLQKTVGWLKQVLI